MVVVSVVCGGGTGEGGGEKGSGGSGGSGNGNSGGSGDSCCCCSPASAALARGGSILHVKGWDVSWWYTEEGVLWSSVPRAHASGRDLGVRSTIAPPYRRSGLGSSALERRLRAGGTSWSGGVYSCTVYFVHEFIRQKLDSKVQPL